MRSLLDTNIVIHREADVVVNNAIGTLFKWLDKANYEKCVHPITVEELQKLKNDKKLKTLNIKLQSYTVLKTVAPLADEVKAVSNKIDVNENDKNDTLLLNEVFCGRVEILVSEDKKIHKKAAQLDIQDRVFTIDGFLEKVLSEHPELVDYSVLSVTQELFGNINLQDTFFNSFRSDYKGFDQWFNRKADKVAYVTHNDGRILSFLYVKLEDENENYADISPVFTPKRRLKIGTFKLVSNGVRLGERFMKIIFDNALQNKVDDIYVTIFEGDLSKELLINLLQNWGFVKFGEKVTKSGKELVYVRDFTPCFEPENPKITFPYISSDKKIFLCPIYPKYHTELFPDSILNTESKMDFKENKPHRNALSKVYISRSFNRNLVSGDIIVFYRTGGYHRSVVTTIGVVESAVDGIQNGKEFIRKCRKRSIFTDNELMRHWNYYKNNRPFIVKFLYVYSFPKRLNMEKLIELGVIADVNSAPRGFEPISKEQFFKVLKESKSDESIIVD